MEKEHKELLQEFVKAIERLEKDRREFESKREKAQMEFHEKWNVRLRDTVDRIEQKLDKILKSKG